MSNITAIALALQTLQADVGAGFNEVEKEIEKARGIGVASTAMSMMDFSQQGYQLGLGAAIEEDRQNFGGAVGLGYTSDRYTTSLRVGVSEGGEVVGGLGFTIRLGQ